MIRADGWAVHELTRRSGVFVSPDWLGCLLRAAALTVSWVKNTGIIKFSWLLRGKAEDQLSVCLPLASGSTFLQRLYRICTTHDYNGLKEHRPRLLRLIELHGDFHAETRNQAGQTLLHTICSLATYEVRRQSYTRFLPNGVVVPHEAHDYTFVINRAHQFTDKLCLLLQRAGADFSSSDNSGQPTAAVD
jgi:hypothetical protein